MVSKYLNLLSSADAEADVIIMDNAEIITTIASFFILVPSQLYGFPKFRHFNIEHP
jgi:hypothetical protein